MGPFLTALIGDKYVEFKSVSEKINALETVWREFYKGKPLEYNHFAYHQILGLGKFALPFLIDKMRAGSTDWNRAVTAIMGFRASDPESDRDAWIRWYDGTPATTPKEAP